MDKQDKTEIRLMQIINDAILSTLLNSPEQQLKKRFEIKWNQTSNCEGYDHLEDCARPYL